MGMKKRPNADGLSDCDTSSADLRMAVPFVAWSKVGHLGMIAYGQDWGSHLL